MTTHPPPSLVALRHQLDSGQTTPTELVSQTLDAIDALNPTISAFVHTDHEGALRAAAALERDNPGETTMPLWGLASADKDLVARAGMPTRYGSRVYRDSPPSSVSDPMASWLDVVGAISVGKTSTSEFGMAGSTEALGFPPTRNPHHLEHSAGGSSGGAAAAVAAGLLPFAPGSDGGGSIRIPALACGVVGWKPSRGLVPAGSAMDSPSGLAVAGLITRTAADLAAIWKSLLYGAWPWSTRAPQGFEPVPARALRVMVSTTSPWTGGIVTTPSPEARAALDIAVGALRDLGHEVVEAPWEFEQGYAEDFLEVWSAAAALIALPEGGAGALEPLTAWLRARGEASSARAFAAALVSQRRFEARMISQLEPFDVALTPGLRVPSPALGWYDVEDPVRYFSQQVEVSPWTSMVNVAGLPGLAVPTHYTEGGLPMGVQVVGKPGSDGLLISLATHLEASIPEATRWPALLGF